MSATTNPGIATGAFPTVLSDLKYALYDPADGTELAEQTFAAPHPERTVLFMGLDRQNYDFKLIEMVGGMPVNIRQSYSFVPDRDDIQYRDPEMLQAGVTVGFPANVNAVTFDGTAGAPDFRGWDIEIERMPTGTMVQDIAYSWDKITGVLTLLQAGDIFSQDEYFNVTAFLIISATQGVPIGRQFSLVVEIDADYTLIAGDAGKKILIQGATDYLEVTLPDINLIMQRRTMFFETGIGNHKCVKIKVPDGSGQTIDFGKGAMDSVFMGVCESFELYRQGAVWRIAAPVGNFLTVGRNFATDASEADEFNAILMDGRSVNKLAFARLWAYVLTLDPGQVTTYAGHGADPTKYSTLNGAGDEFYIPNRIGRHERNASALEVAGTAGADNVGAHSFFIFGSGDTNTVLDATKPPLFSKGDGGNLGYTIRNSSSAPDKGIITAGNGETRVKDYLINRFVLV